MHKQHPPMHPGVENRMLPLGPEAREARLQETLSRDGVRLLAAQRRLDATESISRAYRSVVAGEPEDFEEQARRLRARRAIDTSLKALISYQAERSARAAYK